MQFHMCFIRHFSTCLAKCKCYTYLYARHVCLVSVCAVCIFSFRSDIPTPWALAHFCNRWVVVSLLQILSLSLFLFYIWSLDRFNIFKSSVIFHSCLIQAFGILITFTNKRKRNPSHKYVRKRDTENDKRKKTNTKPTIANRDEMNCKWSKKEMMKSRRKWKYDRKNGVNRNHWKSLE